MKIVFFGTPEFAVPSLQSLAITPGIEIVAVITQKDKPVGRKMQLTPPAVKQAAINLGLPVFQPQTKLELVKQLQKISADFFIVIAYGMILSAEMLQMPKKAAVNVHASLLPKYRGASPIQESLLRGDTETGVSIMKMSEKMDKGPIYLVRRLKIEENDNAETLSKKLSDLSAQILPLILSDIYQNHLNPLPQKEESASYCHKIEKSNGKISWDDNAERIQNQIRAYTPWPGSFSTLNGKKITIEKAEIDNASLEPGEISISNNEIKVGCGKKSLKIIQLRPEGKNPMSAKDFMNGLQQKENLKFE